MPRQQSLMSYASTTVSPGKSKEQIEAMLQKVGAIGFRWDSGLPGDARGFEQLGAILEWKDRKLAFRLKIEYENERERKRMLRALYWYLKAKIEAVQLGLVDLEQEFFPFMLAPSGKTMYEELGGSSIRLLAAPNENEEVEL